MFIASWMNAPIPLGPHPQLDNERSFFGIELTPQDAARARLMISFQSLGLMEIRFGLILVVEYVAIKAANTLPGVDEPGIDLDGALVGSKGLVETVRGILWIALNEVPTHAPQSR